ncbi:hypothetical protein GCM10007872_03780 [Gluconobacter sphaericus NBRC 12467]|uniref:Uncharacterized protein n=1 Tax=Gluconobacter sphaericus NBRC 12467 TaxID=1307951 RepID=A0AA37SE42_9PROT|nr:hypothetical protein AA12467_1450 [Gluconobacter sphaericus NBRC 12467]GEB41360.1 hypothetical protein GSP01_01420 [Gluconobacter sphaericus NBRC 12467]GLQ83470.1 hypothetical protein GCM10007872_03780 [Gluconobacter sphaericus NBRC 12467]
MTFRAAADGGQDVQSGEAVGQQGVVAHGQEHVHMRQEGFGGSTDDGFAPQYPELLGRIFPVL